MAINIRKAEEGDFPAILSLIKELAEFEKAPEKVHNSVEKMVIEKAYFNCFVAEAAQGKIVGMALYFFAYYTWTGKAIYLDDLYVQSAMRRQGLGTRLLKKVIDIAKEEGCKQVRWQVLNWNYPAINMYKKYGAIVDDEWSNCYFNV